MMNPGRKLALMEVLLQFRQTQDLGQVIEDIDNIYDMDIDEWTEKGEAEGWLE